MYNTVSSIFLPHVISDLPANILLMHVLSVSTFKHRVAILQRMESVCTSVHTKRQCTYIILVLDNAESAHKIILELWLCNLSYRDL